MSEYEVQVLVAHVNELKEENRLLREQIAAATSRAERMEKLIIEHAKPARDGAWPCCVRVQFGLLAQWNTANGVEPEKPLTPIQALKAALEAKP